MTNRFLIATTIYVPSAFLLVLVGTTSANANTVARTFVVKCDIKETQNDLLQDKVIARDEFENTSKFLVKIAKDEFNNVSVEFKLLNDKNNWVNLSSARNQYYETNGSLQKPIIYFTEDYVEDRSVASVKYRGYSVIKRKLDLALGVYTMELEWRGGSAEFLKPGLRPAGSPLDGVEWAVGHPRVIVHRDGSCNESVDPNR